MAAQIIDGKAFAAHYKTRIAAEVAELKVQHGLTPGLAVIIVGDDPASHVYVRNKGKAAEECGIHSVTERLPADTTQDYLLKRVVDLNHDPRIHGILVQLPLPAQIDANAIINAIDPAKDVDGFHVINAGKLATGQDSLVPCTPQGCLLLLEDYFRNTAKVVGDQQANPALSVSAANSPSRSQDAEQGQSSLTSLHAVVIGRSNIVGKPMAQLLLNAGCTVTICHSKTRNLPDIIKQADILVAAVGKPGFIKGEWVKPGAVVIDVGINRVVLENGQSLLIGDVDFPAAAEVAAAITPVPGGVGPMTIACLLGNTVKAARTSL